MQLTHGPEPGGTARTALAPHTTPVSRAGSRPALPRYPRTLPERGSAWPLIVAPAVTLAVMLWGITAPAYWGDEADTVSAVSRSLPQLLRMLRHVDVVHGLYYLSLWPVVRVLGAGEFATRLPSALAMAAAALGIAAIARRLASARAALCAGLLFAVTPVISAQGHDARPYGMVTAAAVLASYLLIRAADDPRRRWFAAYGVSLVALGYLELFGLLLVLAHAVTVAGLRRGAMARVEPSHGDPARDGRQDDGLPPGARRRDEHDGGYPGTSGTRPVVRRWLITVMAAVIVVVPLAACGWQQRAQIAWIARPDWHDVLSAATSLAGGSTVLAAVTVPLAVLGAMSKSQRLTWLALPWLVLPTAMLLAASEIKPAYNFRYLVFCLPATALLAGAGLAALSRGSGPSEGWQRVRRWAAPAAILGLIVALVTPTQLSIRVPGTGMREVSQFLAARERPGDAVIYPGSGVPPWYLAYPDGLGRLRDIWMAESGPASGRLYGVRVQVPVLKQRERGICRIWAVEMTPPWPSPAPDIAAGFRLVGTWQPQPGVRLWLYQRPGCTPAPGPGR